MKITGKMLAGYGESSVILAFEADYPNGCEPTPEMLGMLTERGVDCAGFCNDLFADMESIECGDACPEVVNAYPTFDVDTYKANSSAIAAQYTALQNEEASIQNTYVEARNDLRRAWKVGEIDRKTYLEECGTVRGVFVEQNQAFRRKAHQRSLEIMSEFLLGLSD